VAHRHQAGTRQEAAHARRTHLLQLLTAVVLCAFACDLLTVDTRLFATAAVLPHVPMFF
jgi:hypothetical protein